MCGVCIRVSFCVNINVCILLFVCIRIWSRNRHDFEASELGEPESSSMLRSNDNLRSNANRAYTVT